MKKDWGKETAGSALPLWGVIQTGGGSRHGLSAPGEGDLEPQLAHRMSDEAVCTS